MCLGSLFCICIFSCSSQHHLFKKLSLFHCNTFASLLDMSWPCFSSVQFSHSVVSDSLRPGGLQHARQLPKSTQTHVHCVSDAIQPSHPLSSPSPPALNLSQHQGLFKWVSSLHQVAKVLEFQLQHQALKWIPIFRGSISCPSILFFFGQCQLSWIVFVVQLPSHVWVCYPIDCSMPCFPVPYHLLKEVCPNSCPLYWWCHPTTSSSVSLLSFCLKHFQRSGSFLDESALHIRWPKYWNFSFSTSPSNGYSGLISFRIDWFDLLAVQGTLESLLQHHNLKASVLQCSAFFMAQLSHPYMTTGKIIHCFGYMDLCCQSDVFAFQHTV